MLCLHALHDQNLKESLRTFKKNYIYAVATIVQQTIYTYLKLAMSRSDMVAGAMHQKLSKAEGVLQSPLRRSRGNGSQIGSRCKLSVASSTKGEFIKPDIHEQGTIRPRNHMSAQSSLGSDLHCSLFYCIMNGVLLSYCHGLLIKYGRHFALCSPKKKKKKSSLGSLLQQIKMIHSLFKLRKIVKQLLPCQSVYQSVAI